MTAKRSWCGDERIRKFKVLKEDTVVIDLTGDEVNITIHPVTNDIVEITP